MESRRGKKKMETKFKTSFNSHQGSRNKMNPWTPIRCSYGSVLGISRRAQTGKPEGCYLEQLAGFP